MVDWPEFTVVNGYQPNGFEEFRTGMRHFETGDNHGIMRTEYAGERVEEATYKLGKLHGLRRTVTNRDVVIELFKDGQCISQFKFTQDGEETERKGL